MTTAPRWSAGTNPKKAGTDVEGIPVFASVGDAVAETGANASCIFIPAPGVKVGGHGRGRGRRRVHRVHHRGRAGPGRGVVLQQAERDFPNVHAAGPELPGHHQPRQVQHRHHRRPHRQGARGGQAVGRHREPLRHPDLPGAVRAEAAGHRCDDLRRHRRRPRSRHQLHRLPRALRGRPGDERRDDDRRDRRLGRGRGGGVHQAQDAQARRGLHRRPDRSCRQEDGPRRRHRVGRQGHRGGQGGGARRTPGSRSGPTRPRPAT